MVTTPLNHLSSSAFALLLCASAAGQAAEAGPARGPYDGQWSVALVCADTKDRSGLVKGYEFDFHVTVSEGKVRGQYGATGAPASVVLSGEVGADGMLELKVVGNTGQSDQTVGKVARGTAYSYTMVGRLEHSSGQAVRRELRPCTASFGRL